MMHRYNFEALDRCLKDLARNTDRADLPFGGHVVVLRGDFRQIPTVITRGSRAVGASLKRSYLWPSLREMELTINMRVQKLQGDPMLPLPSFLPLTLSAGPRWDALSKCCLLMLLFL